MNSVPKLISKAEQLAIAGDWGNDAIRVNIMILKLNNNIPGAYCRLGRCYEERGDLTRARNAFTRALVLDPKSQGYRNALDRVEVQLKKAADIKLISGVEKYKELFQIGMASKETGDYQLAIKALEKAISIKRSPYALAALAASYRGIGDLERAEAIYREILACSNDSFAKVGLAAVLKDKGRHKESEGLLTDTLRDDNSNIFALRTMGSVQNKKRNRQESKDYFKKAFEIETQQYINSHE